MANIFDYVDWRGDIPFSADPFNEVDALILAELSYTDLEGVLPSLHIEQLSQEQGRTFYTLQDICQRYYELHTEEEVLARKTFTRMAPILLPKLAGSRRFGKTLVSAYVNYVSDVLEEQMAAMVFSLEDGTNYAAFRGTDDTLIGWKEDLNLSFTARSSGQVHAAEYLSEYFKDRTAILRVGGHSKGGNLAVYASAFCSPAVREDICEVWNFDGPGFLQEIIASEEYQSVCPKVKSVIPEQSVFGLLLQGDYPHRVARSSEKGLMQHDGFSWEVMANHFVYAEKTGTESELMAKTMDGWLNRVGMEDRKAFIDAIYEMLSSGGADTLTELGADAIKGKLDIIKSFAKLDSKEQGVIASVVSDLLRSGVTVLSQEAKASSRQIHEIIVPEIGKRAVFEVKRLGSEKIGEKLDSLVHYSRKDDRIADSKEEICDEATEAIVIEERQGENDERS